MADTERRSYPKLPARNWFDLRRRMKQALPPGITVDYLQSVLGLEAPSARNLIAPLRALGLIDDDGRVTDLAHEWRTDEGYADACNKILHDVYPQDLLAAFPPPEPDRDGLVRWFMRNARVGEGTAKQFAGFYLMLASPSLENNQDGARPAKPRDAERRSRDGASAATATTERRRRTPPEQTPPSPQPEEPKAPHHRALSGPSVHIDVQIHIDPNASADQIDQIFASMARHLYGRE